MNRTLVCTAASEAQSLTTPERARQMFDEALDVPDEALAELLADASFVLSDLLGWRRAADEGLPLAVQSYAETLRSPVPIASPIYLSRRPILPDTLTILEGQTELAPDSYLVDRAAGRIETASGLPFGCQVTVSYEAGWTLPGEEGRNLPRALETAALHLFYRDRVDSDAFSGDLEGETLVGIYSYRRSSSASAGSSNEPTGMPKAVARAVERYRNRVLA